MSDPCAYYTVYGDRRLLHTRDDMRRTWLEERIEELRYWIARVGGAR